MSLLNNVPIKSRLHLCNGIIIKNIEELELVLKTMSHQTFNYHANHEEHSFHNWVKNAIGDEELANAIKYKHKDAAASIVKNRIEVFRRLTQGKCPHISPMMDCMKGGFGDANCLDPFFHNECNYRKKDKQ